MDRQSDNRNSLWMLTASMLIFGTIGIFRRLIPLSSGLLAFSRGITGALFLCVFLKIRRGRIMEKMPLSQHLWLMVTGALIGFNWILLFEAYNYTTVAVATLCYYMAPTIVILLSPLFLREKLTPRKLICAAAAIAGMVLVSGVTESSPAGTSLRGVMLGLGAAALYACVVLMNKKGRPADAYTKTIVQLSSAALVLIPYLLATKGFSGISLSGSSFFLLLIVGLVHTGIAYALYFGSMEGLKAQTIAIFSYIDPITALILSALILREPMTIRSILGAVLILGAAAISEKQV